MHQVLTTEIGDSCCSVFLQSLYFPPQLKFHCFTRSVSRREIRRKQMWVSGDGSELWCTRYIATSYLSAQFGYAVYRTTDKVYLSAQVCIRSQTHCVLTLLDHRFKLVSSICVLRKVILSSCFDSTFAIPWARQVTITQDFWKAFQLLHLGSLQHLILSLNYDFHNWTFQNFSLQTTPFLQSVRLNTHVSFAQRYLLPIAFISWLPGIAQFYSEQVHLSQIRLLIPVSTPV